MTASAIRASALPARAGLGLKPEHYRAILDGRPDVGFFEVHAENYMGAGGPPHRFLEAIAARYPLSLHGVGLSIGGEARPRPGASRAAAGISPTATGRHRFPNIWPGRRMTAPISTTCCRCPTPRRRWSASRAMSTRRSRRSGMRLLLENPVDLSAVRGKHDRGDATSWRASPSEAAAACCSTSTTSWSRRSTTGSIRSPISTASRSSWSARSISPAMTRRSTAPATGC